MNTYMPSQNEKGPADGWPNSPGWGDPELDPDPLSSLLKPYHLVGSCHVKDSESFHLAHARLQDGMGVEGAPPRSSIRLDVAWGLPPSPVTLLLEVLGEGGSRRCCLLFSFSLVFPLRPQFFLGCFPEPGVC